jgi:hypothetical protein
MLYCSYFNCMTVFKFLLTTYVQYNFYMRMTRVTSSQFAKYFCDTYYHTMHGNDLCHVRCYMGYASAAAHLTLTGYDLIWLNG